MEYLAFLGFCRFVAQFPNHYVKFITMETTVMLYVTIATSVITTVTKATVFITIATITMVLTATKTGCYYDTNDSHVTTVKGCYYFTNLKKLYDKAMNFLNEEA